MAVHVVRNAQRAAGWHGSFRQSCYQTWHQSNRDTELSCRYLTTTLCTSPKPEKIDHDPKWGAAKREKRTHRERTGI